MAWMEISVEIPLSASQEEESGQETRRDIRVREGISIFILMVWSAILYSGQSENSWWVVKYTADEEVAICSFGVMRLSAKKVQEDAYLKGN